MHEVAVAELATAFNDPNRSRIGDPRRRSYAVSVVANDMEEANRVAKQLVELGSEVRTNVRYDETGEPTLVYVTLYDASDQKRLFELIEARLDAEPRRRFEDLVLARGPIPDDILEKIWHAAQRGWKVQQIADRLNELGLIAGMGGVHWTPRKVRDALAEHHRRAGEYQEVA
jgi:hypothetical protein